MCCLGSRYSKHNFQCQFKVRCQCQKYPVHITKSYSPPACRKYCQIMTTCWVQKSQVKVTKLTCLMHSKWTENVTGEVVVCLSCGVCNDRCSQYDSRCSSADELWTAAAAGVCQALSLSVSLSHCISFSLALSSTSKPNFGLKLVPTWVQLTER